MLQTVLISFFSKGRIIFFSFANDEMYEVAYVSTGQEALVNHVFENMKEEDTADPSCQHLLHEVYYKHDTLHRILHFR
ncbi:DUF5697 family protein [Marvinbryantia formatexigens]|uniref:DUF5697 family protein n=2 Tax=Marvinbryantia formatexigens TaxID=168384 RepID=UPI000A2F3CD3